MIWVLVNLLKTSSLKSLLLCFNVFLLSFLFWYKRRNARVDNFLSSLPGPPAYPIVGNLHLFIAKSRKQILKHVVKTLDYYSQYPIYRFNLGTDNFAVLQDPLIIQIILRNPTCYDKDKLYNLLGVPNILFTANGPKWQSERRAANPSFHAKILAIMDPIYQRRTGDLSVKLRKYAASGETFDLIKMIIPMAIDTISDTFMGVSVDMLSKDCKELVDALLRVPELFVERVLVMFLRPDSIYSLTGKKKLYQNCFELLYIFAQQVIEQRMKHRAQLKQTGEEPGVTSGRGSKIYLDGLIDKYEASEHKDFQHLIHEAGEFFIAGSVTVATIVSWVCLLSGVFPDVGERLHKEIDECTAHGLDDAIIENCSKLEYLDLVVKETLRHFTVPFIGRVTNKDVQISEVGTIPANTRLLILLMSLHHDSKHWQKPYEFYPEHFLPENVEKRTKGAYIPFASGMRDCPGAKYTMQTIKCQVVRILSQFKLTATRMKPWTNVFSDIPLRFGFTLVPVHGWLVKAELKKRE